MSGTVATLNEIGHYLDDLYDWVLKSRGGLTREDAKKIFHRYRSGTPGTDTPSQHPQTPETPQSDADRQARKIDQIIGYMEETTQRLDHIENDIGYLKDKIDLILKKL